MNDDARSTVPRIRRGNFLLLMVTLIVSLVVVPFFEESSVDRYLFHVSMMAVLIAALFVYRGRHIFFFAGLVILMVTIPVVILSLVTDHPFLFVGACLLEAIFFLGLSVVLLNSVLREHLASLQSIFGAISVYLLIGLAWSMMYMALERIEGESLAIENRKVVTRTGADEGTTAFSQLIYFSFVTLSTLGYGDIAPETPLARTLTWTEAVTGQFYLAVLVAFLISQFSRRTDDRPSQLAEPDSS